MESKNITFDDVIIYISHNSENTKEMDILNNITFPFTTKYRNWTGGQND